MKNDKTKELRVLREMYGELGSLEGFKIIKVKEGDNYTFFESVNEDTEKKRGMIFFDDGRLHVSMEYPAEDEKTQKGTILLNEFVEDFCSDYVYEERMDPALMEEQLRLSLADCDLSDYKDKIIEIGVQAALEKIKEKYGMAGSREVYCFADLEELIGLTVKSVITDEIETFGQLVFEGECGEKKILEMDGLCADGESMWIKDGNEKSEEGDKNEQD
ncbi:hypothetical protein [Anaerostipes caccae]|uniref:hypothetical protein n=1 Tax=Anaerostipes caccae TaxID=105841 RepID=UPI0038D46A4F